LKPHKQIRRLAINFANRRIIHDLDQLSKLTINGASGTPIELATAFLSEIRGLPANLASRLAEVQIYSLTIFRRFTFTR